MIAKFKNNEEPKILIIANHVVIINKDEILIDNLSAYKPTAVGLEENGEFGFKEPVRNAADNQMGANANAPYMINPLFNQIGVNANAPYMVNPFNGPVPPSTEDPDSEENNQ